MLNEGLKSCRKMISADIKTDVKQEIKKAFIPNQAGLFEGSFF